MARRLIVRAGLAALLGLLAMGVTTVLGPSPATAAAEGWAQPGYGAGNTYYNAAESHLSAGRLADVEQRWSVELPTSVGWSCSGPSAPLVSGGRLFVADQTGIGAYQAHTGRRLWHFDWHRPADENDPHLAVAGGMLLAANTDCRSHSDANGALLALSVATGAVRWHVAADTPMQSLVVDRGTAVVAGSSPSDVPQVLAYRVRDGRHLWSSPEHWSPGVSSMGRLLLSRTDRAEASVVSVTTGKPLWTRSKAWTVEAASPVGDRFYVADAKGALLCLSSSDGAVRWTARDASGMIAVDDRRVYHASINGIEALDAGTGHRLWKTGFTGDTGQPVRAGGLVYTSVDAGQPMGILSAATGKVVADGTQFGNLAGGNVVVADGWLYRTHGNTLLAYGS